MKKERKPLSEKQLANLAAGRAKLQEKREIKPEVTPVETITPVPETSTPAPAPENNQEQTIVKAELPKVTKVGGRIWRW